MPPSASGPPPPTASRIPISVVYRRDSFHRDATNPLYVYGYGSYGYALPVGFGATRLSLLDRGLVIAYAHIRGGGEMGDAWHDAGKMQLKSTTFTDFIACIEHLTARRASAFRAASPSKAAAPEASSWGPSPTSAPTFPRVVLLPRPLRRRHEHHARRHPVPSPSPSTRNGAIPNEPEAFATMRSYSPYDNLVEDPLPRHARQNQPQRLAGHVLGTR